MFRANAPEPCAAIDGPLSFEVSNQGFPIPPHPLGTSHEKDWKSGALCWYCAVAKYKFVHEAIQRRSEVVGDFADVDPPLRAWLTAYSDSVHALPSPGVQLCSDELMIGISPEGSFGAHESLDFTLRTPHLEARAMQQLGHARSVTHSPNHGTPPDAWQGRLEIAPRSPPLALPTSPPGDVSPLRAPSLI